MFEFLMFIALVVFIVFIIKSLVSRSNHIDTQNKIQSLEDQISHLRNQLHHLRVQVTRLESDQKVSEKQPVETEKARTESDKSKAQQPAIDLIEKAAPTEQPKVDIPAPKPQPTKSVIKPAQSQPAKPTYDIDTPKQPAPKPEPKSAKTRAYSASTQTPADQINQKTAGYKKVAAYRSLTTEKTKKEKKPISIEELLSTKVLVWVAGVALALAGAYLVKYSFDHGILSPGVRISIGSLFGIAMIVASEFLRRKYANIAQALAAAGVADLFACNLAAVVLYPILPQSLGFIFMAGITALAVVLSLRQGIFVALLGLLGGFMLPALIGGQDQHPGVLFTYLLLVEIGLVLVARHRNWWPISALTLVGAMIWPIVWLVGEFYRPDIDTTWLAILLIGSFVVHMTNDITSGKNLNAVQAKVSKILAYTSGIGGLILLGTMADVGNYTNMHWALCGLLGAGCVAVARLDQRHETLAYIAAVIGAILLLIWQKGDPANISEHRYFIITAALGGLYSIGPYVCLWKSKHPGRWATFSVLSAIGFLLIAYFVCDQTFNHWRPAWPWWVISAVIAGGYALASIPLLKFRSRMAGGEYALAAVLVGATALITLALALKLDRQWLTVALAIEIPFLAIINHFLKVRQLRWTAGFIASTVAGRLLLNPFIFDYPLGGGIILNWLTYGYGAPAICMAVGAWVFSRSIKDRTVDLLTVLSVAFAFALTTLQIQHYFNPEDLKHIAVNLFHISSTCVGWLMLAVGLLATTRWIKSKTLIYAASSVAAIGMVGSIFGLVLLANPMVKAGEPVALGSHLIFNWLVPTYGLPAILIFAICWIWKKQGDQQADIANVAGGAAMLLLFTLVGLIVQHGFRGEQMQEFNFSLHQWSTFSVAWLVFAALLMAGYLKWRWVTLQFSANAITAAGVFAVLLGGIVLRNPLWTPYSPGPLVIFNWLLYAYGLPTMLILAMCWLWKKHGGQQGQFADFTGGVAMLLLFTLVGLIVQHGFKPEQMQEFNFSLQQWSTFSAAWLAFAALLMAGYLKWRWVTLQFCSNAIAISGVAAVLLGAVILRNPIWTACSPGRFVIFNWLTYAYGLPMLLILALAWLYQRNHQDKLTDKAGSVAILLLFILAGLQVQFGFKRDDMQDLSITLVQYATFAITWIVLGGLLVAGYFKWQWKTLRNDGSVIAGLGILTLLVGGGILANPVLRHENVGQFKITNYLLYVYGLPALLIAMLGNLWRMVGWKEAAAAVGALTIILAFALVNLEVRQWFNGEFLDVGKPGLMEMYCYSAAWIAFAVILLASGILGKRMALRYASLAVMLLATCKVFLFDTGHLKDLYRVLSYFGLGIGLLVIAFVYQKFVFVKKPENDTAE